MKDLSLMVPTSVTSPMQSAPLRLQSGSSEGVEQLRVQASKDMGTMKIMDRIAPMTAHLYGRGSFESSISEPSPMNFLNTSLI